MTADGPRDEIRQLQGFIVQGFTPSDPSESPLLQIVG